MHLLTLGLNLWTEKAKILHSRDVYSHAMEGILGRALVCTQDNTKVMNASPALRSLPQEAVLDGGQW